MNYLLHIRAEVVNLRVNVFKELRFRSEPGRTGSFLDEVLGGREPGMRRSKSLSRSPGFDHLVLDRA